jgi:uncharacterized protein with PIN domain
MGALLKDRRANGQMIAMAALIPVILLLLGAMADVSVTTSMQTWVSEAALQGARVGSRSTHPADAALAAVTRFGAGVAGWRLGDRLTASAAVDAQGEVLTVEVSYTFTLLSGRTQTARASSAIWLVDTP